MLKLLAPSLGSTSSLKQPNIKPFSIATHCTTTEFDKNQDKRGGGD
jgi:hypothetical protein